MNCLCCGKPLRSENAQTRWHKSCIRKFFGTTELPEENKPRLTLVNYPTGYILKPQVAEFEALPEAEHLVMCMADITGISTVPHALITGNGRLAYITKRVDRVFKKNTLVYAIVHLCRIIWKNVLLRLLKNECVCLKIKI